MPETDSPIAWVRSSKCDAGSCVEVAVWNRSSRCDTGNCVEAKAEGDTILVRDSKDPDGSVLRFTTDEWTAFLDGVRAGDFRLV